jgi:TIR domain
MDKPQIFVSHISEEGALASIFKQHLFDDFLGLLEVFVSSDIQSIAAGQNWLTSLESALRRSSLLLVLCSHASLRRPWVNFEVGAAWMKQIPIVPICHSGLEPSALPVPFVLLQGLHATSRDGLARLSHAVAKTIGSRAPKGNADKLIAEVQDFEAGYTPTLQAQLGPVTDRANAARKRVYDALKDSAFNWRSVSKLAVVSGLTEDEVVELLLTDENVQFGRGKKSQERIARFKNREANPAVGRKR